MEHGLQPHESLIVISCYTRFDNLAHGPKGTQAKAALYSFSLNIDNGEMVLLSTSDEPVVNPAFSRVHPSKSVLYTVTESVAEPGEIITWAVQPTDGRLTKLSSFSAGGTSTCYITIDRAGQNMLVVNYWDATIGVFEINPNGGEVLRVRSMCDPKEGREMKARGDQARGEGRVNHSDNTEDAQKERQSDPHSHAVVLDPVFGQIAYVPDLGMDLVRQFFYDPQKGTLRAAGTLPSGAPGRAALGPRYVEFHPSLPVCYVVNELSSEVAVFMFDRDAAQRLVESEGADSTKPTLRHVQTIRTIPDAYPGKQNTCGRVAVHQGGKFVVVSNRGHDSIVVFRVQQEGETAGSLTFASIQHTRGATPRHFKFDTSGQWMVVANQDSDDVGVFNFNLATGKLTWTGHKYYVPSPNFVCTVPRDGINVGTVGFPRSAL